jgi:hypothetical protein
MPFCQAENCGKTGLLRNEVEFDNATKQVLCSDCYAVRHGGGASISPATAPGFAVGLFLNSEKIEVDLRYNKIYAQVHVPVDDLKNLFKSNG